MATKTFAQRWLSDPAVWPIIGVMGFATSLVGYQCSRYALYSPDVSFDREERAQVLRKNYDEGDKFASHYATMAELRETTTRRQMNEVFRGNQNKQGGQHLE